MGLEKLTSLIERIPAFALLLKEIKEGQRSACRPIWIEGLSGGSLACLLAALKKKINFPFLVILPEEEIEIVKEDLRNLGTEEVSPFPAQENKETLTQRMQILEDLLCPESNPTSQDGQKLPVILASLKGLEEKTTSLATFNKTGKRIKIGDECDRDKMVEELIQQGYTRVDMVENKGELSVRGAIFDIYSLTSSPVRLEFFGDEIVSMRTFDPLTQISCAKKEGTFISAAREFNEVSLLDVFPQAGLIFMKEPLPVLWKNKTSCMAEERGNSTTKEEEIQKQRDCLKELQKRQVIHFSIAKVPPSMKPLDFSFASHFQTMQGPMSREGPALKGETRVSRLIKEVQTLKKEEYLIFILSENKAQAERMKELLKDYGLFAYVKEAIEGSPGEIIIGTGGLSRGWINTYLKIALISLREIFSYGTPPRQRQKDYQISKPGAIAPGDYVVHIDYGIGRFQGIKTINVEGRLEDFFLIEYADEDKLYIPAEELGLLHKYRGREDGPPIINRMGSSQWGKIKKRAKRSIEEYAKNLLKLYAWRKAVQGYAFPPDTHWQDEFELDFPYEETPDQLQAAKEVKEDMERPLPMDRLICGDVGYGKTEVAMRAAFKAALAGKQATMLSPTTILAQQHHWTFKERMKNYPVNIACLSRFKKKKEQEKIIKATKEGKIDVLIGTHRLLQKDVQFHNLGLVIIDEEQRFGVLQKEHLKELKKKVDVLSLSATPIPRTLHMSLSGIRETSVLNTPPAERLSIQTYVSEFNLEVIRSAILREIEREGQVFYVHNRIRSMPRHQQFLKNLLPEIKMAAAHGRMPEKELENIMIKFLNKEYDLLLSTDIVGAGLDIPSVNTIIITDAERYGLAQLYQLRGRVGRSAMQAYAYIFYNADSLLACNVRKRLEAISEFGQLGSGMQLALRDLEIRGAGNILGQQQHGHIQAIGFELYCRLLEEAVRELKGERQEQEFEPHLELNINAYIPDDYISSPQQKIEVYKRMQAIKNQGEIEKLALELEDRYGKIPRPVKHMLDLLEIKNLARKKGISSLKIKEEQEIAAIKEILRQDI